MKKLICLFALVLGFIFSTSSAIAGECPNVVFYGKTLNHKKEVFVCLVNPSKLYYSFGKVGVPKPELSVWATPKTSSWARNYSSVASLYNINIFNGPYVYSISTGNNDEGVQQASIEVYKSDIHIASIKLDPNDYYSDIYSLSETNIPEDDLLR